MPVDETLENVSVVAVRGDAGSRGAALWSAWRAAAACSKMHNSAFYLPLAALAHSTFSHDESPQQAFQKSPCINSTGRTPHFLPSSTVSPTRTHTHTHDSSQSDKENREEASHDKTTTVTGLKITQLHSHTHACEHVCGHGRTHT